MVFLFEDDLTNYEIAEARISNWKFERKAMLDVGGVIFEWKQLPKLDLSNLKLKKLPKLPKHLKDFDCSNNRLKELPKLPKYLKYFDCSNNKLITLPKHLPYIEHFDCSNNKLTTLPKMEIIHGEWITLINCKRNLLTEIPSNLRPMNFMDYENLIIEIRNRLTKKIPIEVFKERGVIDLIGSFMI